MNHHEIRAGVIAALLEIAPEIEADQLVARQPLRDQVDLDSMDWLNLLIGINQRLGVEIPEADYRKLPTLDALIGYLAARLA